jgi:hypothetical protein
MTQINQQQLQAFELGKTAFLKGLNCIPCQDKYVMGMLTGRKVGQAPQGQASTKNILDMWTKGWYDARTESRKENN